MAAVMFDYLTAQEALFWVLFAVWAVLVLRTVDRVNSGRRCVWWFTAMLAGAWLLRAYAAKFLSQPL